MTDGAFEDPQDPDLPSVFFPAPELCDDDLVSIFDGCPTTSSAPARTVAVAAAIEALAVEPAWLDVHRVRVSVESLPVSLHGFTIVQIIDAHRTGLGRVETKIVEAVRRASPQRVVLTGLSLYATDDSTGGTPRAVRAPSTAQTSRILLTHSPAFVDEHSAEFEFDLCLAGHTHGGQITAGGLAVAVHGAPRATADIDLLVPPERAEDAVREL